MSETTLYSSKFFPLKACNACLRSTLYFINRYTVYNINLKGMGGDQCQKYLFLVDVQTYFVGTFSMVIFLFERHFQI